MKTKNKEAISTLIAVTIAISILVAFSATASAADKYVATTGSDTAGDGSEGNPWKTIQYAVDNVNAGDTINVAAGTYNEMIDVPYLPDDANRLTIQSTAGAASTIIDCGGATNGVQIVSNDITFSGFTVRNAYNLISQVSGNDHVLSDLILTDFVNYGMSVLAAHDCTFSDITIHDNDDTLSADRTVKGIDIQEYGSGGNTNNQFEDITIYDIETTGLYGTSMGIFLEGDNPGTHPTLANTFTNIDIYDLASAYFNCGVYILDMGSAYTPVHSFINPYAIEDTTFSGGSIYGFTENGVDVVSRGFYVKGGNKNLDITCFDITGCDDGVYFRSFAGTIPPTFPPTGWINDDSWATSTGSSWVKPRTGTCAAGVEMGTSTPDDYLIMPQQSITTGDTVSLYARGSFMFGSANFKLLVSTTGDFINNPYDTLGTYTVTGYMSGSWLSVSEDLSDYNGQDIYIAIYAYEQGDGSPSELLIDDVTLPDGTTEGFEGTTTTIGAVDVTVNCNDIYGNTNYGVDNSNGVGIIDAECNWWGDTSGPSGVGPGTGDAVSTNVDFDPWIASLIYTGAPQPTTNVVLEATLSDSTPAGMSGYTVDFYIDNVYFDSATTDYDGVASCNIGLYPVGVYDVYASACCLESDPALLAIYDPAGGFVTGGGWINSPAGAYVPDPDAEGKANFGFVSKYKKGQSTPTGNTQFQFKAGDLNFHSDSYDWLVIAGHKAMYKGTGTINGAGNYGFMLSAIDEKLTSSTDIDKFRIRIGDKDNDDENVYDNQMGDSDADDPTTEIAGGQIVIRKAK